MKIQIAGISHRDPAWLEQAVATYQTRLPRHWQLQFNFLRSQNNDSQTVEQIRADEWQRIHARLLENAVLVALDETGESWDTRTFAKHLQLWQEQGNNIALIIGGAEGLAPECKTRAAKVWSLSKLTFPHQFVKLILVEQLYRAYTILQGHPYHRG